MKEQGSSFYSELAMCKSNSRCSQNHQLENMAKKLLQRLSTIGKW